MLKALIFDVDGTLADTESAHRHAFNLAFREVGLDWHWDEPLYTRLLSVAGGKERILHYWTLIEPDEARGCCAADLVDAVHAVKTHHYTSLVAQGAVPLRTGVQRLIEDAQATGLKLAIATTTTPANVDVLLREPLGARWRERFAAVCDGGSVPVKKPAPDVYHAALAALGLAPSECLAFEDSRNGLLAAHRAGIGTVVTPSAFTASERFDEALLVLPHLGDPRAPLDVPIACTEQRWVDTALLAHLHQQQRTTSCAA